MISQTLNIVLDYSYSNNSLIVDYKDLSSQWSNSSVRILVEIDAIYEGFRDFNHRDLNDSISRKIYNIHRDGIYGGLNENGKSVGLIPKRYVYSNMHL